MFYKEDLQKKTYYSKTSQSADFGTEQNTADFEIRRLQVTTRLDMLFSPTLPE